MIKDYYRLKSFCDPEKSLFEFGNIDLRCSLLWDMEAWVMTGPGVGRM